MVRIAECRFSMRRGPVANLPNNENERSVISGVSSSDCLIIIDGALVQGIPFQPLREKDFALPDQSRLVPDSGGGFGVSGMRFSSSGRMNFSLCGQVIQ